MPTTDLVTAAIGDITFADYSSFISADIPPIDAVTDLDSLHEIESTIDDNVNNLPSTKWLY